MISRITYGYDAGNGPDRYISIAKECQDIVARSGRPGAYLVDIFPFRM